MTSENTQTLDEEIQEYNQGYSTPFLVLTAIFFMWGMVTVLNTVLLENFSLLFRLSITEGLLIKFIFFIAYFIVSLPAGKLIDKIGYKSGIITGLVIAGIGAICFYPAAEYQSFEILITAMFIVASGITILQVGANPYVALLGPADKAASRLTLKQAFNSFGTFVAPLLASTVLASMAGYDPESLANMGPNEIQQAQAEFIKLPYLFIAFILFMLAAIFSFTNLPSINTKNMEPDVEDMGKPKKYVMQFPHLVLGAFAIFFYVGAEESIGTSLLRYLTLPDIGNLTTNDAIKFVSFYWGGAMVGRFIGAGFLTKVHPGKAVGISATIAAILVVISISTSGALAMWSLLLVGLFNSILFPTIFVLGISGLGKFSEEGSSILIMAIVGGAVIPFITSKIGIDNGIQTSLLIPVVCYLFIVFYGFIGSRYTKKSGS